MTLVGFMLISLKRLITLGVKTNPARPFLLQNNSCHLQLISLCVAHRIKHLTMLLCVMLCQLICIFGVTDLEVSAHSGHLLDKRRVDSVV